MATFRVHTRIARPADAVWEVVSDAGGVTDWFPGITSATFDGTVRTLDVGGLEVKEEVVTSDDALRRFQYRIVEGVPVEHHLGTVDVLEDGDGALVVYGLDIAPDEMIGLLSPMLTEAIAGLKAHLER